MNGMTSCPVDALILQFRELLSDRTAVLSTWYVLLNLIAESDNESIGFDELPNYFEVI
jgi:hypothetical protein